MKLKEIKNIFEMDCGNPSPKIISYNNKLYVLFNIIVYSNDLEYEKCFIIEFENYIKYKFGLPNSETIYFHSYEKLGLSLYSFYELENSDFIKEEENIQKLHERFNNEKWKTYKHYILTFHDNIFECISKNFKIINENNLLYKKLILIFDL